MTIPKDGTFYSITETDDRYILLDKTKRGLECREKSTDEKTGIMADKGTIYDMDGIGYTIPIRWYYSKGEHSISDVTEHAESMEKKYTELRDMTCPND